MKLKRWLCALLSMSLLIPSLIVTAAEGRQTASDVAERLYKLYLIERIPEEEVLGQELTRQDAVAYLLSFSGIEAGKNTGSYSFSDIDRKNAMAAHIEQAYLSGIVNGYTDGTFRPEEKMTYAQTAMVLVNILGYEQMAGSFPHGVMRLASEMKFALSKSADDIVTLGEFLQMLDKAKNVAPLDLEIAGEQVSFFYDEENTHLSKKHDIYYKKGIVNANHLTALSEERSELPGYLEIDGEEFTMSDRCTDEAGLLGCYVEYYYYEDNSERVLLWAKPHERNERITIRSTQLLDFSGNVYHYLKSADSKRETRAILADNFDMIYNGVVDLHPTVFMPQDGTVTLIDNNFDGRYDVVMIESLETVFVGSVYYETYQVRDFYTQAELTFDEEEDSDVVYTYYKDGKPARFSDIQPNNVLSIARSRETNAQKAVTIYISATAIEGEVSQVYQDSQTDIWWAVIGEETYPLHGYIRAMSQVTIRDKGTFYLDYLGRIAGNELLYKTGMQYGYLMKVYVNEETTFLTMKILTESGKILYFDWNEKTKINDIKDSNENVLEMLKKGYDGRVYDKVPAQPIRFATNRVGEITKLYTHDKITEGDITAEDDKIKVYYTDYTRGNTYNTTYRSIGMRFGAAKGAVCFRVPDIESQVAGRAKDEDFTVEDVDAFKSANGYRLLGFDNDDIGYCSLLLRVDILGADTIDNQVDAYAMVDAVIPSYDEASGEAITKVYAYAKGERMEMPVGTNTVLSGFTAVEQLTRGTIIQFKKMQNGTIACIRVVSTPDNFVPADTYDGNRTRENVYVRGQVQKKNSDTLLISYEKNATTGDYLHEADYLLSGNNKLWFVPMKNAPVYVYDKSEDKITVSKTFSEVRDYETYGPNASLVMCHMTYMAQHNIFVINE